MTVENLPDGTTFTFYVKANPAKGSRFTSAREGSVSATTVKDLSWSASGTYYRDCSNAAGLYSEDTRTLKFTAATGIYTLENFFGTGADLVFKLDGNVICPQGADGTFAGSSAGYWGVPLGTAAGLYNYVASGYCEFAGDENGGELWFYYLYNPDDSVDESYWTYDWFEWSK